MANKAQQYITALKEIAIKAQDEFNEKWKDFEEKEKETTPSFGDKLTNEQIDYGIDLDNLLHLFRKTNKEIEEQEKESRLLDIERDIELLKEKVK